ncbi:MAG: redox-regulated ATPase YchF, partial [Nitrospirae bacterium RIFCSPLOWO2_01_FULL_62_17]
MIGLPNVGKTTVFNALTGGGALAANYPFATVDPNTGIALVPDPRLTKLTEIFKSKKTTPATLEVRDIAGLVEGASKGEGLGNQFLGHIREVDALLHIVRCFQGTDVVHVSGSVDPLRDIGVIETELMLADLETLERRKQKTEKKVRAGDKKAAVEMAFVERLMGLLDKGEWLGNLPYTTEERTILDECQLLAAKPVLFVANVSEGPNADEAMVRTVREFAEKRRARVVTICGQLEAELSSLPEEERADFLKGMGLTESGLVRLTREAYQLLRVMTFFTAGEQES